MMTPLPTVSSAYDHALQHEQKLKDGLVIGKDNATQAVAFVVPSSLNTKLAMATTTGNSRGYTQAGKKLCRYCKKEGHILDKYRKLKWKKQQEQNAQNAGNIAPPA